MLYEREESSGLFSVRIKWLLAALYATAVTIGGVHSAITEGNIIERWIEGAGYAFVKVQARV